MLFDTHAHYDDERFDEDRDTLLASMPENNVGLILNPGCDVESSRKAVSYANKYPFVYAAVGIHPENIEDGWEADLETIRALAQNESKVRAIGEIGLDYYWEKDERARARQQAVFARQMELARALHLPVIVHDRDAHADSMEITRRYPGCDRRVPLLCRSHRNGTRTAETRLLSVVYWCYHIQKCQKGEGSHSRSAD